MASREVLQLINPGRFLREPFQIADWKYDENDPDRAQPSIAYDTKLVQAGIYIPNLLRGFPLYKLSNRKFYWFDQRLGGKGGGRADIAAPSGNIIAAINLLIRFGEDVIAVQRANPVNIRRQTVTPRIQFLDGQALNHEADITAVFEYLNRGEPTIFQFVIERDPLPLSQIVCSYNRDF